MKWTLKNIALIVMCAMLLITVVMAAVVIGKVAPIMGALMSPPDPVTPSNPTADTTAPTEDPTQPTTKPEATDPAHTHNYAVLMMQQKATCTRAGYSIYACDCGSTHIQDHVDAKGHSYGASEQIRPSCTAEGYTMRKCTVCGDEDKGDVKAALGHDDRLVDSQKADCEQDGFEKYKCSRSGCDYEYTVETGKATGHNFAVVGEPTEPGCENKGVTERACKNCGKSEREEKPALGHSFGDWEVTVEPSAGNPGEQTQTCSACGGKKTRACELKLIDPTKIESENGYQYTVNVVAKDSAGQDVTVYIYEIYDAGRFDPMNIRYDAQEGLIVSFTDKDGKTQTYYLGKGNGTLKINENGQKVEPGQDKSEQNPTE